MKRRLICAGADLEEKGRGVRFVTERHGVSESAFVVRYGGQVHAYLNRCAHVPVELDWQEGEFFDFSGMYLICATHGAMYSPESGRCLGGRCNGKGLVALSVIEDGSRVFLLEEDTKSGG